MKRIFRYFLLFVALTVTTGCDKDDYYPSPKFEVDPTAGYIDVGVDVGADFDTMISQEAISGPYYNTYFCLCNASDHKIYVDLTFDQGGEFVSSITGVIDHGQKCTGRLIVFKSCESGLISSFTPLLAQMEVYYDVENEGFLTFPSGIEERYTDFSQRFKSRQICDQGQWIYEELTPRRARWTYILTNEDYERAKMILAERD